MIISRENNFGAGEIKIQAYQASNYVVLNTKFTIDPTSEEYRSAEVLEIKVPSLTIDRSAITPVFVAFHDRRTLYGTIYDYDSCTILKSWIKDPNTICIEKFDKFDSFGILFFYIATLYPQLNQGVNVGKSTKLAVQATEDAPFMSFENDASMVVNEHWVFLKCRLGCYQSAMQGKMWEFGIKNFPADVNIELAGFGGSAQYHYNKTGFSEIRIKEGRFISNFRMTQGQDPTIFAFIVRGDNAGYPIEVFPQAVGDDLLRAQVEDVLSWDAELFLTAVLELGGGPFFFSVDGTGGSSGSNSSCSFKFVYNSHKIPKGNGAFYGRSKKQGSLAISYNSFSMNSEYDSSNVSCICSLPKHEEYEVFDTGLYVNS